MSSRMDTCRYSCGDQEDDRREAHDNYHGGGDKGHNLFRNRSHAPSEQPFRAFQDIVSMQPSSPTERSTPPIVAISFILFRFHVRRHRTRTDDTCIYLLVKKGMMRRSFGQVMKYAATSSIVLARCTGASSAWRTLSPRCGSLRCMTQISCS